MLGQLSDVVEVASLNSHFRDALREESGKQDFKWLDFSSASPF